MLLVTAEGVSPGLLEGGGCHDPDVGGRGLSWRFVGNGGWGYDILGLAVSRVPDGTLGMYWDIPGWLLGPRGCDEGGTVN